MTATGHALIGTLIAAKIGNPYVALPLAFGSHLLFDLLPHWDAGTHGRNKTRPRLRLEAAADVLISFFASYLLIFFLFPTTDLVYAFILIITAQGIDWLTAPYYMFNMKNQPFKFFHDVSSFTNSKLDKPWGIISQVTVVSLLTLLALLV